MKQNDNDDNDDNNDNNDYEMECELLHETLYDFYHGKYKGRLLMEV